MLPASSAMKAYVRVRQQWLHLESMQQHRGASVFTQQRRQLVYHHKLQALMSVASPLLSDSDMPHVSPWISMDTPPVAKHWCQLRLTCHAAVTL